MSKVEHFDLTGKNAVVLAADNPAGKAIADACEEAGANVARHDQAPADKVDAQIRSSADEMGGLHILACAPDLFIAKPIAEIDMNDIGNTMMANFAAQYVASQTAVDLMRGQGNGGNIILTTSVLGERGLPNTTIYSAAHGAVFNFIRALAQEVAPDGISVNGIALGWMDWMDDRIDPKDESAARAVRFTMLKRPGTAEDVGPLAVWLGGTGVGFVTGQIFPVDGGLTQHL
ncbi:MAG: SDR family oxidoreductase [Pseudomonadales bacterium]|nr:SDR family oxidoreductase [Pseudomonadales bacterium]